MNITEEQWAEIQRRSAAGSAVPVPIKPKLPKPRMNKWEALYAQELEARRVTGEIDWWGFEAMKLRLADNTFYTPDFVVCSTALMNEFGIYLEFHEVKGFWRDDARVKIKVAAELFPFRFVAVSRIKGSHGWHYEEFVRRS